MSGPGINDFRSEVYISRDWAETVSLDEARDAFQRELRRAFESAMRTGQFAQWHAGDGPSA